MGRRASVAWCVSLLVVGCSSLRPLDEVRDGSLDAGSDAGSDAGAPDGGAPDGGAPDSGLDAGPRDAGDDGGSDAGDAGSGCPAVADRMEVVVNADITADVTWTCEFNYILDAAVEVVRSMLTIDAGVVVRANVGPNGLIVSRGSTLQARGTRMDPIVFTSAAPVTGRASRNWSGIVLMGGAGTNSGGGTSTLNDVPPEVDQVYGGSTPTWSCGRLEFVRVEFAGRAFDDMNDHASVTLAGCGSDTVVDHLQVHESHDDGLQVLGGTVGLQHVVITGARDAGLRWNRGWRGSAQYLVVQSHAGERTDNALEGSTHPSDETRAPASNPTIYNATFIGSTSGTGVLLADASHASLFNVLSMGFSPVVDVQYLMGTPMPAVIYEHSRFVMTIGPFFEDEMLADDDNGYDEMARLMAVTANNRFGVPHGLRDPMNETTPGFEPTTPPDMGFTPPPPFDPAAHIGAMPMGGDWTAGWTDYPGS